MNLYEISNEYIELQEVDIETAADGDAFIELMNELAGDFRTKVLNCARAIKNLEAEEVALKEEEARLNAKRKARTNRILNIKTYLNDNMKATGIKDIHDDVFKIVLQKNLQSVDVIDEAIVPKKYWIKQDPKLDKKTLLEDLKHGTVKGAKLKQGESVRIK